MDAETLTPEQIKNWRQVIFMQLEEKSPGAGIYAIIMPEADIVAYWKKMKALVEEPKVKVQTPNFSPVDYSKPKKCNHSNSITGQNGTYCLDCEKYI